MDDEGNVGSGTLTCTIRVDSGTEANVSGSGTGVVVIPSTVVSYQADDDDLVYLCMRFTYANGTTVYHHSSEDPSVESHWTTAPSHWCGPAMTSPDEPDILEPLDPIVELFDSINCPVLALVFPPQGDIPGIWDCPPYDA